MRKQRIIPKKRSRNITSVYIVIFLVSLIFAVTFIRGLKSSLFFNSPDRLNILIYNKDLQYYSLGLRDNVHYVVRFYPDLKVIVPGGYGYYRLGGISKLVQLENKPSLFQKTFTLATSTFTDFYFYPKNTNTIEYGTTINKEFHKPNFSDIFRAKSNANIFNKLYIYLTLANKTSRDFKEVLSTDLQTKNHQFDRQQFMNDYSGYFYDYLISQEKKTVQILYNQSYNTAEAMSDILQGNGVRVSDISRLSNNLKSCFVSEHTIHFSYTARKIANFFHCQLVSQQTGFYDIVLTLGTLEKDWEVD